MKEIDELIKTDGFKGVLIGGTVAIAGALTNINLMDGKSFLQSIGFVGMILGILWMGMSWGYSIGKRQCNERN